MDFIAIDYSSEWFIQHEQRTPPVRRGGKFVVLSYQDQTCYMIFSPIQQSGYHANIIERFSQVQQLSGCYNSKRDSYALNSSDWHIHGGGHWKVDEELGLLRLFGRSMAYGAVAELPELILKLTDSGIFQVSEIIMDAPF